MTTLLTSFETGANGTAIPTTGVAGDGDAFAAGTNGTGTAFVSDNATPAAIARGSYAGKITIPATAAGCWRGWNFTAGGSVHFRIYMYLTAYPTVAWDFIQALLNSPATTRGRLRMTTTGALAHVNGSTAAAATTGVIPLNQLVRIEGSWSLTTSGTFTCEAYLGHSTTPIANTSINLTGIAFAAADANQLRIGVPIAQPTNFTFLTDSWGISDTARLGPDQAAADTTAPTVPTGVTATANSQTQVTVAWTASTDAVGVSSYRVRRDGADVATAVSGTSFVDTSVVAATPYSYTVSAVDAAGNRSAESTAATVTTPADPETSVQKMYLGGALLTRAYLGSELFSAGYLGSSKVWGSGGGSTPPPQPATTMTFATSSQVASLSTTSPAALRAKAIADGVKGGTYVGGLDTADVKNVDNRAGAIALTMALWYLRTGDSSYLGPLKTFVRACPKPPDETQALNEFRGLFGIFAAVKLLQDSGDWTASDDAATCPNHNGDTWTAFVTDYHIRTVGGANLARSLRGTDPCVDKTANNWGAVARATHLMWAVITDNAAEIEHSIKVFKKYLGDQTQGIPSFQPTANYIASWDNWGLSGGLVQSGIGKSDPSNPGLDGVVIDDICRGATEYNSTADHYGATGSGLTYPLEAADYVWAQAACLINGGHAVRTWGEGGNAFDRMNDRLARKNNSETSLFEHTEGSFAVYRGGKWIAAQISQKSYGAGVETASGTTGLSRAMPYGDWLAPADGSSTWGR